MRGFVVLALVSSLLACTGAAADLHGLWSVVLSNSCDHTATPVAGAVNITGEYSQIEGTPYWIQLLDSADGLELSLKTESASETQRFSTEASAVGNDFSLIHFESNATVAIFNWKSEGSSVSKFGCPSLVLHRVRPEIPATLWQKYSWALFLVGFVVTRIFSGYRQGTKMA